MNSLETITAYIAEQRRLAEAARVAPMECHGLLLVLSDNIKAVIHQSVPALCAALEIAARALHYATYLPANADHKHATFCKEALEQIASKLRS